MGAPLKMPSTESSEADDEDSLLPRAAEDERRRYREAVERGLDDNDDDDPGFGKKNHRHHQRRKGHPAPEDGTAPGDRCTAREARKTTKKSVEVWMGGAAQAGVKEAEDRSDDESRGAGGGTRRRGRSLAPAWDEAEMYRMAWEAVAERGEARFGVRVIDTVLFRASYAYRWIFTSKKSGRVLRRHAHHLAWPVVAERMLRLAARNVEDFAAVARSERADGSLAVRLLTRHDLASLGGAPTSLVSLQPFPGRRALGNAAGVFTHAVVARLPSRLDFAVTTNATTDADAAALVTTAHHRELSKWPAAASSSSSSNAQASNVTGHHHQEDHDMARRKPPSTSRQRPASAPGRRQGAPLRTRRPGSDDRVIFTDPWSDRSALPLRPRGTAALEALACRDAARHLLVHFSAVHGEAVRAGVTVDVVFESSSADGDVVVPTIIHIAHLGPPLRDSLVKEEGNHHLNHLQPAGPPRGAAAAERKKSEPKKSDPVVVVGGHSRGSLSPEETKTKTNTKPPPAVAWTSRHDASAAVRRDGDEPAAVALARILEEVNEKVAASRAALAEVRDRDQADHRDDTPPSKKRTTTTTTAPPPPRYLRPTDASQMRDATVRNRPPFFQGSTFSAKLREASLVAQLYELPLNDLPVFEATDDEGALAAPAPAPTEEFFAPSSLEEPIQAEDQGRRPKKAPAVLTREEEKAHARMSRSASSLGASTAATSRAVRDGPDHSHASDGNLTSVGLDSVDEGVVPPAVDAPGAATKTPPLADFFREVSTQVLREEHSSYATCVAEDIADVHGALRRPPRRTTKKKKKRTTSAADLSADRAEQAFRAAQRAPLHGSHRVARLKFANPRFLAANWDELEKAGVLAWGEPMIVDRTKLVRAFESSDKCRRVAAENDQRKNLRARDDDENRAPPEFALANAFIGAKHRSKEAPSAPLPRHPQGAGLDDYTDVGF